MIRQRRPQNDSVVEMMIMKQTVIYGSCLLLQELKNVLIIVQKRKDL